MLIALVFTAIAGGRGDNTVVTKSKTAAPPSATNVPPSATKDPRLDQRLFVFGIASLVCLLLITAEFFTAWIAVPAVVIAMIARALLTNDRVLECGYIKLLQANKIIALIALKGKSAYAKLDRSFAISFSTRENLPEDRALLLAATTAVKDCSDNWDQKISAARARAEAATVRAA
ncbi:hypothetical protein ISN45_Aa01g036880, partial [Arabidopsis thaliana x Arabidopsis arenosa]